MTSTRLRLCVVSLGVLASLGLGAVPAPAAGPINVPAKFFGLHIGYAPGSMPAPPWATPALRLHGVGVPWCRLNPEPGTFEWGPLDAYLQFAQHRGADLIYTFSSTPRWASGGGGRGCPANGDRARTAPPSEAAWRSFVSALVKHAAGRIRYYELWNEANSSVYWSGSVDQMVRLTRLAAQIIRANNPAAKLLTPSITRGGELWLRDYLSRVSKSDVDIVAFHGYPVAKSGPEGVIGLTSKTRKAMAATGFGGYPVWNTEGGWGPDRGRANYMDAKFQRSFVARNVLANISAGVGRFYWYRYDGVPAAGWGTLAEYQNRGLTPGGIAMREVIRWIAGATLLRPCQHTGDGLWTCDLTRPLGRVGRVVWVESGSRQYGVSSKFRTVRTLEGGVRTAPGKVTIGTEPVLLDSGA